VARALVLAATAAMAAGGRLGLPVNREAVFGRRRESYPYSSRMYQGNLQSRFGESSGGFGPRRMGPGSSFSPQGGMHPGMSSGMHSHGMNPGMFSQHGGMQGHMQPGSAFMTAGAAAAGAAIGAAGVSAFSGPITSIAKRQQGLQKSIPSEEQKEEARGEIMKAVDQLDSLKSSIEYKKSSSNSTDTRRRVGQESDDEVNKRLSSFGRRQRMIDQYRGMAGRSHTRFGGLSLFRRGYSWLSSRNSSNVTVGSNETATRAVEGAGQSAGGEGNASRAGALSAQSNQSNLKEGMKAVEQSEKKTETLSADSKVRNTTSNSDNKQSSSSSSSSSATKEGTKEAGEKSEAKSGEKAEVKGEKTETKSGEKSETKTEEKAEAKSGEKSEAKSGEKAEVKGEEKAGEKDAARKTSDGEKSKSESASSSSSSVEQKSERSSEKKSENAESSDKEKKSSSSD